MIINGSILMVFGGMWHLSLKFNLIDKMKKHEKDKYKETGRHSHPSTDEIINNLPSHRNHIREQNVSQHSSAHGNGTGSHVNVATGYYDNLFSVELPKSCQELPGLSGEGRDDDIQYADK